MLGWIRRRLLWVIVLPLLVVGLYALAGFWWLPRFARAEATDYVREELGKSLSLGDLRFNPFTFRAEATALAIQEPAATAGQKPLVALRRAVIDFQVSSLWKGAWTFREVTLDGPYAQALVRADGSLNLADLVPPSKDDGPPPDVLIAHLVVADGAIDFADHSRRLQPSKRLAPIQFELRDFRTAQGNGKGGGFQLAATGDQGERFDWRGQLSLRPFASDGELGAANLQVDTAYAFLSEALPFEVHGGRFDVAGRYRFAAGTSAGTLLEAALSRAQASGVGVRVRGETRNAATLGEIALAGARFSLGKREVAADRLRVGGLRTALTREANGAISLMRLFPSTPEAASAPAATTPGPAWRFNLGEVALEDAEVDVQDRAVRPASRFHLQALTASTRGVSLDLDKPLPIAASATVNGKTRLAVQGEVVPATVAGRLQLDLTGLPLRDVLAYLPDFPAVELRSGTLGANGELTLPGDGKRGAALAFNGEGRIDGFSLLERASKRQVVAWERMDIGGLRYAQAPDRLQIARVVMRKPFAIVAVEPDRTVNLSRLFASRAPASSSGPAMAVKLDDLQLENGTMAFADASMDPGFRADIAALRGHIRGLSTAPSAQARVDLHGQVVNRYSPVEISGTLNPFAYDERTDLKMSFRNIDLPIFNPYSGRFAGYAIAKGKLSTELHYQIDHRKLQAAHHVVLDQLEWGEATDSQEKVSLPIRLATSLLKNRQGVIDLDLPVNGSLDDPSFRVWPIVWQILKNILVKAVTAPFDFIGSLFKGAEQARYVDFAAGSSELGEPARTSLGALAKALVERPALRLDIPAGTALEGEAEAIAGQRLDAAMLGRREGEPVAVAALEAGEQRDLLEALYRQQLGRKPDIPEAAEEAGREADQDELDRKARKAARQTAEVAWLRQALLPRYRPGDDELAALGRARANAVQDALLAGGEVDPTRVFIDGAKGPAAHEGGARLELGLE
ncbi:DUF748 domain-containing protein [Pseudoxanthomonas beigongshangi]|uniref:DUF748 domain-containing protein n=1 Tax=Pseudoxanthomonas beigongshangi TaxID=2782537 RepID=UPI00193B0CA8|nr:DUF748 domain-containing protein [Pseudoxanthomonas beigongshangi]